MDLELSYSDKASCEEVISNTPRIYLCEKERFGQIGLDTWVNRLIFGDNLAVLKTLLEGLRGQVRLIYIDPPFSTNQEYRAGSSRTSTVSWSHQDQAAYKDKLVGAEYLEFLRRGFILSKELLAEDGSIYVHIDWKMGHYVKVIMDEIFGQKNFINDIARVKCNPKNFERRAYGNIKDMILFYSKSHRFVWNNPQEPMTKEDIEALFKKVDQNGRRYTTIPLHAPGETRNGDTGRQWKGLKPPQGRHWRTNPDELTRLDEEGLIEWSRSGNPRRKIYADQIMTKKRQDIWWEFKDPFYPSYPTEKNLEMLKLIIEASSNQDDLVLDYFAGSGTTLIAAEQLGRRWIGIDNSSQAIERAKKRLKSTRNQRAFILLEGKSNERMDSEEHQAGQFSRLPG